MLHISILMHEIGLKFQRLFGKRGLASALYNDNNTLLYIYVVFSKGTKTLYRQYYSFSEYPVR